MELLSLKNISRESKMLLLKELGYDTDGTFVLDSKGNKHNDPYIDQPVKIENMLILPGSTVILDDNEFSIAAYIEEHGDVF